MSVVWFFFPLGRCEQTFIYLAKEMIYRLNKSFCLNLGRWTDDLIGDTGSITKWVTSVSALWPRRPAWVRAQECYTPGVSVNLCANLSESSTSQKLFTAYVTLGSDLMSPIIFWASWVLEVGWVFWVLQTSIVSWAIWCFLFLPGVNTSAGNR